MTHRQTRTLLKIVFGLALIFIIYCLILFMIQKDKNNYTESENKVEQIKKEKYLLRCIDDSVYSVEISADGNISNISKTDININFMRELDKKSLNDGIYVNTKAELLGLIEDFSS